MVSLLPLQAHFGVFSICGQTMTNPYVDIMWQIEFKSCHSWFVAEQLEETLHRSKVSKLCVFYQQMRHIFSRAMSNHSHGAPTVLIGVSVTLSFWMLLVVLSSSPPHYVYCRTVAVPLHNMETGQEFLTSGQDLVSSKK